MDLDVEFPTIIGSATKTGRMRDGGLYQAWHRPFFPMSFQRRLIIQRGKEGWSLLFSFSSCSLTSPIQIRSQLQRHSLQTQYELSEIESSYYGFGAKPSCTGAVSLMLRYVLPHSPYFHERSRV